MSYQSECERDIRRHYEVCPTDMGAVRSAYGDAAHLCDAIAKDFIEQNRSGKRKPPKAIQEFTAHINRIGTAIFELRDKVLPNPSKGSED